ncbi:YjeF family domain-containing protein [Anncaliia algerae PRA339]|uniref:ATP-dependent (S)-NAD(P)H-hydrate dehydratase n=1 Tax=Anncaliia algerae PRA339 TaxID=1288291 RepID=A0A059F2G7_9MICR|nr:YjeF family domain-containing protein [Anncaliia algerae PRA339]
MEKEIRIKHPFKTDSVKGDSGCVLVIGGSQDYVGAPYFTASGALLTGSDLVYIFCQKEALIPLKTLLPEAIVSILSYNEIFLRRIASCIIGPGLGILTEESESFNIITQIVNYLSVKKIPIVLDGDGLRLYFNKIFKEYPYLILTPNVNERKKAVWLEPKHLLIEKGRIDIIRLEEHKELVSEKGLLRRCGGQGDILVGILGTFLSWIKDFNNENLIQVAKAACVLTRKAGRLAEEEKGFSVIASDLLKKIPDVLSEVIYD